MSQFQPSYDIQRPTGQCAATGESLEPGQTYYATLVEAGDDLHRVDVSEPAWREGFRPPGLFSYWKTQVPEPTQKKKLFVDDAVLMNLLERLADATQPQRLAFRYVLALILMRKKLLRFDTVEKRGEQEWWVFTPKLDLSKGPRGKWDEQRQIEVLDPHLDAGQIEQVTSQLGQILEAEL